MIATLAARFTVDDWWVGPVSIVLFGFVVTVGSHVLDRIAERCGKKRGP